MDGLIYVSMSGAKHATERQSTIANNLANASTPGFKAQLDVSRAVQAVGGAGYQTRAFAVDQTAGTDFSVGVLDTTGRDLDVAVTTPGFIAVQTETGEAYTRNGSLQVDANGLLRTQSGNLVMGEGGPITIPDGTIISIGPDGTISGTPVQTPSQSLQIERIKLVKPNEAQLDRGSDGLFRTRDGQPAQADASVKLKSGALEGSNVNSVSELVDMITYQRSYEMQLQMMQTADQDAKSAAEVMQLS